MLAYKERGAHGAADVLGAALARSIGGVGGVGGVGRVGGAGGVGRCTVIVPVPSAGAIARQRGGDHVRRLACVAARGLRRAGHPAVVVDALRVTAAKAESTDLTAAQRAANLRGSMTLRGPRISEGRVIVVDDIVTTGATLLEATRVLTNAGRRPVGAAVVLATQRRFDARAVTKLRSRFDKS
jgi:predicted amidophosphoribosyltransferase